jgi:arylsulfatase A-like enzyme
MTRRTFLTSTLAAAATAQTTRRQPNIVLIVLDDLGYGDLGPYGQTKIRTPNIDALAAQSMRFTDCYAGGAVCAPSRSVLMTGLHTGHTPIRANAGTVPIALDDVTVAQVLQKAGYTCGGFGKWGLGDAGSTGVPSKHGFDEFFGYLHQVHAHSYYPDFLWDNEKKHPIKGQYSADLIADRSFAFIRKNKKRQFFLYACYTLPHAKFEGPDVAPYENEPWTKGQKTYAAMVTRADRHVGRVLDTLKENGLEQNTVVLVTSDNGAHFGEEKGFEFFRSNGPLRGEKGQLYEGGIRVPMLVRWPGVVKPKITNAAPWCFQDIMPTFAEIAGVPPPRNIDGVSVLPLLKGSTKPVHDFLYWEFNLPDKATGRLRKQPVSQAVRMGNWKAVRAKPGGPLELYDLSADIGESKDVAAAHPDVVAKIQAYLKTARTEPRPHDNGSMQFVT